MPNNWYGERMENKIVILNMLNNWIIRFPVYGNYDEQKVYNIAMPNTWYVRKMQNGILRPNTRLFVQSKTNYKILFTQIHQLILTESADNSRNVYSQCSVTSVIAAQFIYGLQIKYKVSRSSFFKGRLLWMKSLHCNELISLTEWC